MCENNHAGGAGTVVITNPTMVQGTGGWMSGLISTSPIPEVIDRIEEHGGVVFDRVTACLDPLGGASLAQKMGFSRIAVPISDPDRAEIIRTNNPDALLFGVHMSGITENGAQRIVAVSDPVTGCASKIVGMLAGKKASLQVGAIIPIFALTLRGKDLIMKWILEANEKFSPIPFRLPVVCNRQPEPLI